MGSSTTVKGISSIDITRLVMTTNAALTGADTLTLAAVRLTTTSSDTGVMFDWLELY